jgi:hypothetical protein
MSSGPCLDPAPAERKDRAKPVLTASNGRDRVHWENNMSKRRPSPDPDRRRFLKGATLAGAAALTPPVATDAQVIAPAPVAAMKAVPPGPIQIAVETLPPELDPVTQTSSGGDFMVDVFKTLDIDYQLRLELPRPA